METTRTLAVALLVCVGIAGCVTSDDFPDPKTDVGSQVADGKPAGSDLHSESDTSQTDTSRPDAAQTDLKDTGGEVDAAPFALDITCPDGSKADLSSMPNCDKLVERVLDECCPEPNQGLNKNLAGMVCVQNADGLCGMALESETGFELTCDGFKTSEDCS